MKIAACDFDGTLFRDGVVSEADLEAIADWRRSGNAFGLLKELLNWIVHGCQSIPNAIGRYWI